MLALAEVGPADLVYDLGCGDGRIVVEAARRHGARGVCVEIEADLLERARRKARAAGVEDRIRFVGRDLFRVDLHDATVVTLYLNEDLNRMLRPKLFRELSVGTRVVSHRFGMGSWQPDVTSGSDAAVHLWIVPAPVGGVWQLDGAERLRLHQHFGSLEVWTDGSATLRGNRIALELSGRRLAGTVDGDVLRDSRGEVFARRLAADASGVFTWSDPEREVRLELDPPRAALLRGRRRRPVEDLLLFGDSLHFSVAWPSGPRRSYSGLVEGDRILGTRYDRVTGERPWEALREEPAR